MGSFPTGAPLRRPTANPHGIADFFGGQNANGNSSMRRSTSELRRGRRAVRRAAAFGLPAVLLGGSLWFILGVFLPRQQDAAGFTGRHLACHPSCQVRRWMWRCPYTTAAARKSQIIATVAMMPVVHVRVVDRSSAVTSLPNAGSTPALGQRGEQGAVPGDYTRGRLSRSHLQSRHEKAPT